MAVSRTVNTGNYSSVKVDMGESLSLGPDASDVEAEAARLAIFARLVVELDHAVVEVTGRAHV